MYVMTANIDDKSPSERLRDYRETQVPRMTQTDLALAIGLNAHPSRVSAYESGRAKPNLETAFAIERLTDIPASAWL